MSPYYNPYSNQGAMTSFGSYGPTSATSNIGGRSYASRAYGGEARGRGGPGSYQSQAYQPQQQAYQPYTSPQDRSYIRRGGQGGYGQNPFAPRGGGVTGMGGPGQRAQQWQQQGAMRQQQQQRAPYQAFDQSMQALPGMQQAFGAMGVSPEQQQQMFQQYFSGPMSGLFGMGAGEFGRGAGFGQNPFDPLLQPF